MHRAKRIFICIILFVVISSSACSPQGNVTPVEYLSSPTASLTASPTIDWFPATPTSTMRPTETPAPTADLKPGVGSLLFEDTFQNEVDWVEQKTASGNVALGSGELTLAVQAPKGNLVAFRNNTTVSDFYTEVTVNASLCKGEDMAGFIFRSVGSQSYYRYLVDCNGRVAAQVVIGNTPTFMRDWAASSQLQPGLPYKFTMGIWAVKNVMRFFINGELQFEITRDLFRSGGLGFSARAASDSPLTINFSDLKVYSVNLTTPLTSLTPPVTLTPTPVR